MTNNDSEDEFPSANDSSQSQQVVVAPADPGASRHVMGDAVVANSGRFHVGVDEEHLIPATSSTVPASSGALRNVAPRVHTQFVESPLSTGRDSSVVEGSAIPASQVSRGVEGDLQGNCDCRRARVARQEGGSEDPHTRRHRCIGI